MKYVILLSVSIAGSPLLAEDAGDCWDVFGDCGRLEGNVVRTPDGFVCSNDTLCAVTRVDCDPNGVSWRRTTVRNVSDRPVTLTTLCDRFVFDGGEYDVYAQANSWQNESLGAWSPLVVGFETCSPGMRTCSGAAPVMALWNRQTGRGRVFHLLADSNWSIRACRNAMVNGRAQIRVETGFDGRYLRYALCPGEEVRLPEIVSYDFGNRLDLDCHKLHAWWNRRRPAKSVPSIYNTWLYRFDGFNLKDLLAQVAAAGELGFEYFVVDAGWYGPKGNWGRNRGDWEECPDGALAGRMDELSAAVRRAGMKFGFWLESETVSGTSKIAHEHPDWVRKEGRQGFYDFSNPAARTSMVERTVALCKRYQATFIKQDFNQDLDIDRTGRAFTGYHRAFADYLDEIRRRVPGLYIEGCASGGLRMDLGRAREFDSFWLSDNQSPYHGLRIVKESMLRLPPRLIERWFVARSVCGLQRHFNGDDAWLLACDNAEWSAVRSASPSLFEAFFAGGPVCASCDLTALSKKDRDWLAGVLEGHRKDSAFWAKAVGRILTDTPEMTVLQYSDEDFEDVRIFAFAERTRQNRIRLRPVVKSGETYRCADAEWTAGRLETDGLEIPCPPDGRSVEVRLRRVRQDAAAGVSDAELNQSTEMNAGAYGSATAGGDVRVVFIGNSITLHGSAPQIGWTNVWGMAASACEKDYVHLVAAGIERETGRKPELRVRNLADFERGFETYDFAKIDDLVAFRPDFLVVALGENVRDLKTEEERLAYRAAFKRLLGRFMRGRAKPLTVVRGVFWPNAWKDACMAHAASDYALPFVRADFGNDLKMKAFGLFSHGGVANHPGDRGMAAIAETVLEGLFPKKSGYSARVDGREVAVRPIRISAVPFNQWAAGYQRPADQTEIAGLLRFETTGAAEVCVTPERAFTNAVVRPLGRGVKPVVGEGSVRFTLPGPGYYVLELDGRSRPLEIFADKARDFSVERAAATRVFGPGIHLPVTVRPKSGERIFLDRDAVVYGAFLLDGVTNVTVSGYGTICGSMNRRVGNACYREGMDGAVRIIDSKGVTFDGPTVLDSCCWCVSAFNSSDLALRNLKVTGAWRYNTDGIDICNSQRVRVENCYVHSFDDALVVKGISHAYAKAKKVLSLDFLRHEAVEDVRFSDCVCWCSWGRTLEIGLETWANAFRGIVFENCDLIHNEGGALSVHLGGPAQVEDVTFSKIRVEYDRFGLAPQIQRGRDARYAGAFRKSGPWLNVTNEKMFKPNSMYSNEWNVATEPHGNFRRLTLRDIDIVVESGTAIPPAVVKSSAGSFGEIVWENVRLNGRKLEEEFR